MDGKNEKNNADAFKLSDEELELVSGGKNSQQQAGLPCPQCGGFIPINITTLLCNPSVVCPHCNIKLHLSK